MHIIGQMTYPGARGPARAGDRRKVPPLGWLPAAARPLARDPADFGPIAAFRLETVTWEVFCYGYPRWTCSAT
jgi:hypothetical protein